MLQGFGSEVDAQTINAIASNPDNGHAFTTADFSGLLAIINDLVIAMYGAAALGTVFTIESVAPDGTVSVTQVVFPPE